MTKRYDPADEHDPFFTIAPPSRGDTLIRKPAKSVAHGKCPDCATERKVGLIRQGAHLVWREHWVKTYDTQVRQCRVSGATLCEHPAVLIVGEALPRCTCGGLK